MTSELQTHFLNLYSIALADAEFDEKEIAIIYRLGEEKGIPKETIDSLLLSPPPAEQLYLPDTLSEKIEYLYDYAKMILADGIVHTDEINTLEKFCIKFQFEEENVPAIAQLLIEAAKNNTPQHELINFVTQNN
jgi:uncharacterized tellurite resistance protein B-like protein